MRNVDVEAEINYLLIGNGFSGYFDFYSRQLYSIDCHVNDNWYRVLHIKSKATKKLHAMIFFNVKRTKLETYIFFSKKTLPVTKEIIIDAIRESERYQVSSSFYDILKTRKIILIEDIL